MSKTPRYQLISLVWGWKVGKEGGMVEALRPQLMHP